MVVDEYVLALDQTEGRLNALEVRLTEMAATEPYREPVSWLRCFRGIDTLTAIMLLAELHDFRRFQAPRALMAYVGLVPGEDSSGERQRRGRITRAGTPSSVACWSRPPGTISTAPASVVRSHTVAPGSHLMSLRLPTTRSNDCVVDFDNSPSAKTRVEDRSGHCP